MQNEIKTEVIMILDTPNKQGRIYKSEDVAMAISKYTGPLWCHIDNPENFQINMEKIAAEATNLRIEDNAVVADIKLLSTPSGKMVAAMVEDSIGIAYRTWGHGVIDPITKEISDFTICGIAILPTDAVA